jgi:hypothetical protein
MALLTELFSCAKIPAILSKLEVGISNTTSTVMADSTNILTTQVAR